MRAAFFIFIEKNCIFLQLKKKILNKWEMFQTFCLKHNFFLLCKHISVISVSQVAIFLSIRWIGGVGKCSIYFWKIHLKSIYSPPPPSRFPLKKCRSWLKQIIWLVVSFFEDSVRFWNFQLHNMDSKNFSSICYVKKKYLFFVFLL